MRVQERVQAQERVQEQALAQVRVQEPQVQAQVREPLQVYGCGLLEPGQVQERAQRQE